MSTRGAWGFIKNNELKVTYCHGGAYVEHLGEIVLGLTKKYYDVLENIYDNTVLVNADTTATDAQIKEILPEWSNFSVGSETKDDWYCLLRNVQNNPEAYTQGCKYMIDSHEFVTSPYCEYSYIINLDERRLEVHRDTGSPVTIPLGKLPETLTSYINQLDRGDTK